MHEAVAYDKWTVLRRPTDQRIRGRNLISRIVSTVLFFTLGATFQLHARQAASLRVVSPNGGEQWIAGTQWTISWTLTGAFTKLDLHFSPDNGATWTFVASPSTSSSTYAWQVPAATNSPQCRVRMTAYYSGGQLVDASDSPFSVVQETSQLTIPFSGRSWRVETGLAGPGSNLWWNSIRSVWVDQDGNLHLRLRKIGNQWYCAEISTLTSLGYGEYRFSLLSDVENLDPNIVIGFFLYASDEREYDIEFSRWKNKADTAVGSFTVQGTAQFPRTQSGFRMGPRSDTSTHKIVWSSQSVAFESYRGLAPSIPSPDALIHRWTYAGRNNFIPGNERAYINIWLAGATPPANLAEAELVVQSFVFVSGISAVEEEHVVKSNWLLDVFPNPLNPSTTVRIALASEGFVRLTVIDVLGREVARVVEEELPAGVYEKRIGPLDLPSGIYFCRMQSGAIALTRKLIVLK